MVDEVRQMQAIFPDMPREVPVLAENGDFTALWSLGLSSLFQALQENFKREGILFPPLTAANMTTIQNLYTGYIGGTYNTLTFALPDISGQTVYDSTTKITNQFVIATDGSSDNLVTLAQWVPLSVMLTYAGNPNGNVAGVLNWLCYDSTDVALYICTASGNAADATWSSI